MTGRRLLLSRIPFLRLPGGRGEVKRQTWAKPATTRQSRRQIWLVFIVSRQQSNVRQEGGGAGQDAISLVLFALKTTNRSGMTRERETGDRVEGMSQWR